MKLTKYYRTFLRDKLNKNNRARLKNHDFTIISSNCVGGVITHELGQRFDSPTVNLYFEPSDYLKFLKNFRHYIEDGILIENKQKSVERGYPVGILEDITLYFVHYESFEQAKEKWIERCKRIHWDNIYFLMTQRDGCSDKQVKEFDELPYQHKVIFTRKKFDDVGSSYFINNSLQDNGEVKDLCLYRGKFNGARIIDDFDYVKFLNKK